jgi:hypothetical protein
MHSWNTFHARINHKQTWIHKTHHGPDLGKATIFPLITPKCHFVPGLPSGNPKIFKIGILVTLEAHNFVFRTLIEVRYKEKL